jgi:hypothetical protein
LELETQNIQAIIITGFNHLPWSRYLFVHADDAHSAQAWLSNLAPQITHSSWTKTLDSQTLKPHSAINLAISYQGLVALGLDSTTLHTFPEELIQGMGANDRARRLGDNGQSDPVHWEYGNPNTPSDQTIHFLLVIQTATEAELDSLEAKCRAGIEHCHLRSVVAPETGRPLPEQREHFGFHDSISQPEIEGTPKGVKSREEYLRTGEFILGYQNEYGLFPATPTVTAQLDVKDNLPHTNAVADGAESRESYERESVSQDPVANTTN